ncbi:MAG: class I SAM-dependent methyltransferase [Rubrivivax sp.]|nr:class I SAM-dependent methyltransferase [Rubrivivax sp.]
MTSQTTTGYVPRAHRDKAYTTPRPDVFAMVPISALHVLDVGCSNGALGLSLKNAQPGRRVSGIEFDPDFAREAAASLDHVVQADLNALNWDEALAGHHFDCIVFADVLEHLVDPKRCLMQASKRLQPGGSVVVSVPNIRHVSALWAVFAVGRFPRRDRGLFDRTHLRWFTITDLRDLLADCGLRVCATAQALRWGDGGGGRLNRLLNRLPAALQRWAPVREFLTYQVCIRAEVAT